MTTSGKKRLNFKEMNEMPLAIAAIDFCSNARRRIDDASSVSGTAFGGASSA
ncbi:hypothetical protein LVY75_26465 [Sinorhizobium sp. B11]